MYGIFRLERALTTNTMPAVRGDRSLTIRRLQPHDSLQQLTAMLHRSFACRGRSFLNGTGIGQFNAVTCDRTNEGACYVAVA
jgi:hypothetical protein